MTERLAFLLFAAVLYTGSLIYCSLDYGWTSLAARQAVYVAGATAIIITIGLLLLALVLWLLTLIFRMLGGTVELVAIIQAQTRRS